MLTKIKIAAKKGFRKFNSAIHITKNQKIERVLSLLEEPVIPRQMSIEWLNRQNHYLLAEINRKFDILYSDLFTFFPEALKNNLKVNNEISIKTDFPIAYESNDHLHPESTTEGTVRYPRFVKTCERLYERKISFLDIACGGGGLVFDFALKGHTSIGIDGSDFCKETELGYWHMLPDNFFTADITKEFSLVNKDKNANHRFEIITMYEALEHIPQNGVPQLIRNIQAHLADDGYFIGSVSLLEYNDPISGACYHVTLKPKAWWEKIFKENGLKMIDGHPFKFNDFYRGVGRGYQDPHNYATHPSTGFHFVAIKS